MMQLSLSGLEVEKVELQKDLFAFKQAYNTLRKRLLETSETHPERSQALERWCGTWACIGSLELSLTSIGKQIEEVIQHIDQIHTGQIENSDPPPKKGFGVIDGGIHE